MNAVLANRFWLAVRDCLIEFHNFQSEKAADTVMGLCSRVSELDIPASSTDHSRHNNDQAVGLKDMIYHAEPWSIACNVTGKELPLDECRWQQYQQILGRHQLA